MFPARKYRHGLVVGTGARILADPDDIGLLSVALVKFDRRESKRHSTANTVVDTTPSKMHGPVVIRQCRVGRAIGPVDAVVGLVFRMQFCRLQLVYIGWYWLGSLFVGMITGLYAFSLRFPTTRYC